jgi:hypothetical protein
MAATNYREKRRARSARGRGCDHVGAGARAVAGAETKFVAVGTTTWSGRPPSGAALSFVVRGRYEIRVAEGFQSGTLMQLVRTLEQL